MVNPANNVPAERTEVKKEAVAGYRVKTDDPLNEFYFSVQLFETKKTFHYLMQLEFESHRRKRHAEVAEFRCRCLSL